MELAFVNHFESRATVYWDFCLVLANVLVFDVTFNRGRRSSLTVIVDRTLLLQKESLCVTIVTARTGDLGRCTWFAVMARTAGNIERASFWAVATSRTVEAVKFINSSCLVKVSSWWALSGL